ncbi:hypothetical protein CHH97_03730 [Bacillus licheniformis]|nr:hypothetical protein [Bacillus licheniformis]OAG82528.1 hypothetical protein AWE49_20325 [Bacillus licheniformis]PAC90652.1 hypothetical protein CHH99_20940 [Bacillus licheniformis]PAD56799.1 hypothetical protein CHH97_03730 [Bacillus licheniformis]PAD71850.1 hypothetical protein CHH63_20950 [Bacillus licheniformis]
MQVNCDKCGGPFAVVPQEKTHRKGIIETYFTCPFCRHHYSASVTNHRVRRLIDELKTLRLSEPPTSAKALELRERKAARLKAEIDAKMAELKRRYCGDE